MTAARSTPPHPGSDRQPARPRVALWRGVARASESVDRLARRVSRVLLLVSLCALAVIVSMTCADVLGAKLFRHPMAGFTSAVGIVHLIAIACAMGATFHEGRHIKVEIFLHGAPARLRAAIGAVTDTAGFLLFAIVIWRLLVLGQSFRLSGGDAGNHLRAPLSVRLRLCGGLRPDSPGAARAAARTTRTGNASAVADRPPRLVSVPSPRIHPIRGPSTCPNRWSASSASSHS